MFFVSGRLLTLFSLFPALTKKLPVLNSLFYLPPWNSTHVADLPVAEKKKKEDVEYGKEEKNENKEDQNM